MNIYLSNNIIRMNTVYPRWYVDTKMQQTNECYYTLYGYPVNGSRHT